MIASLIADRWSDDAQAGYAALLREELNAAVHGEVDEESWHVKQGLLRRQSNVRKETKPLSRLPAPLLRGYVDAVPARNLLRHRCRDRTAPLAQPLSAAPPESALLVVSASVRLCGFARAFERTRALNHSKRSLSGRRSSGECLGDLDEALRPIRVGFAAPGIENPDVGDAEAEIIVELLLDGGHAVPPRKNFDADKRRSREDVLVRFADGGAHLHDSIASRPHLNALLRPHANFPAGGFLNEQNQLSLSFAMRLLSLVAFLQRSVYVVDVRRVGRCQVLVNGNESRSAHVTIAYLIDATPRIKATSQGKLLIDDDSPSHRSDRGMHDGGVLALRLPAAVSPVSGLGVQ